LGDIFHDFRFKIPDIGRGLDERLSGLSIGFEVQSIFERSLFDEIGVEFGSLLGVVFDGGFRGG
jgi:hypothetical protein